MQPVLGKTLPFRTINDIAIHFQDQKTCLQYLTQLRWAGKPKCAFCGHEHVYELKGANKRYKCAKCRKHFSAIKGTIFENSTVPLAKWFMAIFLLSTHRKGISGYFGETDHPIPWQIDHLNCWRTDAANAVEAFTKIVI